MTSMPADNEPQEKLTKTSLLNLWNTGSEYGTGRDVEINDMSAIAAMPPAESIISMELDDVIEGMYDGSNSIGKRKRFFDEINRRNPDLGREQVTNLIRSL